MYSPVDYILLQLNTDFILVLWASSLPHGAEVGCLARLIFICVWVNQNFLLLNTLECCYSHIFFFDTYSNSPLLLFFKTPFTCMVDTLSHFTATGSHSSCSLQGILWILSALIIQQAHILTCAVPILLNGFENRILTDSQLDRLEAFQGEIGRILKLSRFRPPYPPELHLSGHLSQPSLHWGWINWLLLLHTSSCCNVDPQSLRLIQKCQSLEIPLLENKLNCHSMTDLILMKNEDQCSNKKQILEVDLKASLKEAAKHQSTVLVDSIPKRITLHIYWDIAVYHGH